MIVKRKGLSRSEAGKLGAISTKRFYKARKEKLQQEYKLKPNYCLYCGNIIPFEKKNNKCCCISCAISYGNKQRKVKLKENRKQTIKKVQNKKIRYCKYCGSEYGKCKDSFVCSKHQIYKTLQYFGFNINTIGTNKIIEEFYRVRNIIENEYKNNRITQNELKEKYNYKSGLANFHKILKSLLIETYNSSKANAISISLGRLNPGGNIFKDYFHKSWEGNIYHLRSSYEDIYANELDNNKIKYQYENLRIKYWDSQRNEYRCAIPDFYLEDENMIVEIKSSYTLDIQNMKDKKKAYLDLDYQFKCICDFKEIDI